MHRPVRRHHEGTYQQCLLVTGIAVDFGLSLGLATSDIERLHPAAMFHDIATPIFRSRSLMRLGASMPGNVR